MNGTFLKEAAKLAAYAFVTVGLAGTVIAQSKIARLAFKGAKVIAEK